MNRASAVQYKALPFLVLRGGLLRFGSWVEYFESKQGPPACPPAGYSTAYSGPAQLTARGPSLSTCVPDSDCQTHTPTTHDSLCAVRPSQKPHEPRRALVSKPSPRSRAPHHPTPPPPMAGLRELRAPASIITLAARKTRRGRGSAPPTHRRPSGRRATPGMPSFEWDGSFDGPSDQLATPGMLSFERAVFAWKRRAAGALESSAAGCR